MAYKMKPFKSGDIVATRAEWEQQAEGLDIPFLDYAVLLEWVDKHIDYSSADSDSFAYGIFNGKNSAPDAIVEIVHTKRPTGGWLKMLSVKLSPSLAPAVLESDPSLMSQVVDIYATSVVGTFVLTNHHKAKVVKLYGRNDSLLKLLFALSERFKSISTLSSKMEGRWLVVKAK